MQKNDINNKRKILLAAVIGMSPKSDKSAKSTSGEEITVFLEKFGKQPHRVLEPLSPRQRGVSISGSFTSVTDNKKLTDVSEN